MAMKTIFGQESKIQLITHTHTQKSKHKDSFQYIEQI